MLLVFSYKSAYAQQPVLVSKISPVSKSDTDSRDYRYLTLDNSLRVLLVSDTAAEKSAAALNVHVGSHQNPKERAGLAHLLEHMLFLGTEKYPAPGEYQAFISQHGGSNNAYTGQEYTNYFFDIEHGAFEQALDRFAQFFITPSFDAAYVEQEKNVVNAEYLAKLNDDSRREWDVYRGLFNPEHPAANFPVGNLETLANTDGHNIRDDLINFYQSYYSASVMTLVVLSNRKLDDMQKMIEPRFLQIANKNLVVPRNYPALFLPGTLPLSVSVKPVKERRQLTITFPLPNYSENYKTKPLQYISHLLGNESSGSLLALLKGLGWAEALHAGQIYESRHDSLFSVSISLTREGVKAKDQIVSALFDYLKIISLRGVTEWRFNEMQQIANLNYRFGDKATAIGSAAGLAQAMQEYPSHDVLSGEYAYSKFDEELIKHALGYLRKDNVFVSVVAPEVTSTATSNFYKTIYSVKAGISVILDLKPIYHQKLWLPERNIFIPKNLVVKSPSMLRPQDLQLDKHVPALMFNTGQLKLWFLQDKKFHVPKAEFNFRFKLPALNNSLENAARTQLFTELVVDQLNEYAYPASIAGLTFSMLPNAQGFDLKVSGYTDKQSLLLNKIFAAIAKSDFSQSRFDETKERLIRDWRNEDKNLPYSVLLKKVARLQYTPHWEMKEYIEDLEKTSFIQFERFSADILRGAKVEGLLYGNLYSQDAIKLSAIIEHQLLNKPSRHVPQAAKILRTENKVGKSWLYIYPLESSDRAVELYIQALAPFTDDMAHMQLLTQILAPKFYNLLRTVKQIGYVVSVSPIPIRNVEGSLFIVQSPNVDAATIIDEANNFLYNASAGLTENFSENKSALLAQLGEAPLSIGEQSEKFWRSILLRDYSFTRQQELINEVNKITPESLRKYYEATFLPKSRRLWLSTEKMDNLKDFDLIQNIARYQQQQQDYLQPE